MESKFYEPTSFATRVDPEIRELALARRATSAEIEVPPLMMTPDKLEKIESLRYAPEVLEAMDRRGDIVDVSNPRNELIEAMRITDAPRQRKNNIEYAVQRLSTEEYGGLLVVKKILQKRPNGKEVEQFARLDNPGSYIIIDPVNFAEYKRLRTSSDG